MCGRVIEEGLTKKGPSSLSKPYTVSIRLYWHFERSGLVQTSASRVIRASVNGMVWVRAVEDAGKERWLE